ncbi:MAG TPA: hypothetical protein VF668_08885 [Pyrinomonadaceae bacterium]|jgi:hypothetical protein
MQREVQDAEGTKWVCAQAYAGLAQEGEGAGGARAAGKGEGEDGRFDVVCTPSGGAQTVRLRLRAGWEDELSDEDLLREIEAGRSSG